MDKRFLSYNTLAYCSTSNRYI